MQRLLKDEYNPGGIGRVKPHKYFDAPIVQGESISEYCVPRTYQGRVKQRKPDVWKMSHYNMRGHSMTRPVKEEKK
jgi:hypothetical protein